MRYRPITSIAGWIRGFAVGKAAGSSRRSPAAPRGFRGYSPRVCSTSAFTLIEAMMAICLVAIATISIISLLTFCVFHSHLEQERARAHQIACEKMEQIQNKLFTRVLYDPDVQATQTIVWDNGSPDDTTDDTNGVLEVYVTDPDGATVDPPIAADEDRRLTIEVTLTWSPRGRLSSKIFHETVMGYKVP